VVVAKGYLTLEEFLRIPEQEPELEYEDGRVTQKVSPTVPHIVLQQKLVAFINAVTEPPKLSMAFGELRIVFGPVVYVPDVAVYSWPRIPRDGRGGFSLLCTTVPDAVFEITSPDQSVPSLRRKCQRYLELGVPVAALVNIKSAHINVFRPGQPEQVLRGSDRIDLGQLAPDLDLTVQQLFSTLRID
jgi:Uma2 family endonuclease